MNDEILVGRPRILTPELHDWIHEFVVNNVVSLESWREKVTSFQMWNALKFVNRRSAPKK